MKSLQIVVTSANSPLTIPLSPYEGSMGVGATPAGSGNYTVTFTLTPTNEDLVANQHAITAMTTATTALTTELGPVTGIVVTLHSGTSVTMDLTQSNV
jgi:hypothetical protein